MVPSFEQIPYMFLIRRLIKENNFWRIFGYKWGLKFRALNAKRLYEKKLPKSRAQLTCSVSYKKTWSQEFESSRPQKKKLAKISKFSEPSFSVSIFFSLNASCHLVRKHNLILKKTSHENNLTISHFGAFHPNFLSQASFFQDQVQWMFEQILHLSCMKWM